ncbi:MAG: biotin synthase BioB, partial [Spirochaetia bacterium]|nr:biotin synthase BioB [Spirochaetia bacterium]
MSSSSEISEKKFLEKFMKESFSEEDARLLLSSEVPLDEVLNTAEYFRKKYFENYVQIHVINNIKNGYCQEDCGYCAQRKGAGENEIIKYYTKSEDEILKEAESAYKSGAFRYCLVTSGRGPGEKHIHQYADLIQKIKSLYPMEICLSAGLLTDPDHAKLLAEAGLNRYNHNINSSENHYGEICTSHDFQDRIRTLQNMSQNGVGLCSGVIAGMGESDEDLVRMAFQLKKLGSASIPVNFFIPVPGHAVKNMNFLTPEKCLRILSLFRLVNPSSEIRMAAGREYYLKDKQQDGLRAANSLFVSGYLNVKGDDAYETVCMIHRAGYKIDTKYSEMPEIKDGGEGLTLSDVFH